jgi:glucose-6-phosphate isomerase
VEPAPDLQDALQEAIESTGSDEPDQAAEPESLTEVPAHRDLIDHPSVQRALKTLEEMEFVARLWVKDATLWTDEADVQAGIRNRLGWLTAPTLMREYAADVKAFATEVRRLGFSNIVLLGMGGSSLAPEVMNLTFGSKMGFPDFTVLDSTDPAAVKNMVARLQLARTLFVVSSKSGTTTEVLALYRFFRAQVEAGKPPKPGQNFIAITDPGSPLEKLARDGGFRRTFLNHPSIGGRFSALSFFGLVPAALIGVDIDRLLERASEMSVACSDSVPERQNPGTMLGAVLGGFALVGRNKVTFSLTPKVRSFGSWLQQMIGESTGKDGKGLVPVDAERLGAPEVYGSDRLFVSIALASETPDPALDALEAAGHPVYRLTLKDPYDLGAEFLRWELATVVAAALLRVNPFDEPNVAQAKDATLSMLATFKKLKRLPDWPVDREEDGIMLLTNQGSKPATLTAGLGAFLGQAKPGDYVAILAYLTPEHETTEALQTLATVIRDRLSVATTVDYGPRYLHSMGQLHKGGTPNVLAIQLTCDDKEDVAIPGEGYGFSALKAAQALGDLETLRKANRRVIRLHLGGRAQNAIEKLTAMVGRATQ